MEAIGRLAGGVAHDFNNLLTAILGYSELLLSDARTSGSSIELAREIRKAAERAAELTGQLLSFGRRARMAPQVLDLNALVADMERLLRRLIGADVELVAHLAPDLGQVHADLSALHQVVVNLAINARDAMPDGGTLTLVTANVDLDEAYARQHLEVHAGPHVLLELRDTGCGMTAEVKSHLFEPFFTTKAVDKGTGLGLSTIYGIVKQSGGHIEADSAPGRGTTFRVYLPRVAPTGVPATVAGPVAAVPGGSETVLLVEDQELVRRYTRHVLTKCGYRVLEAAGGPAALEVDELHAGPIHLLVTDMVMPGMKGSELAQCLTAHRPQLKVLFVSGYTEEQTQCDGLARAGVGFLQKPFTPTALARRVRDLLDGIGPGH